MWILEDLQLKIQTNLSDEERHQQFGNSVRQFVNAVGYRLRDGHSGQESADNGDCADGFGKADEAKEQQHRHGKLSLAHLQLIPHPSGYCAAHGPAPTSDDGDEAERQRRGETDLNEIDFSRSDRTHEAEKQQCQDVIDNSSP